MESLVTAHPVSEGMSYEDLLRPLALRESLNQLDGIGDLAVECRITRVDDLTTRFNGFVEFRSSIDTSVVVHFEWKAQWIHLLVASPTVRFAGDSHTLAKRVFRLIRQHGIDRDWHVGNSAAEQAFANPTAAEYGMVVHGVGM